MPDQKLFVGFAVRVMVYEEKDLEYHVKSHVAQAERFLVLGDLVIGHVSSLQNIQGGVGLMQYARNVLKDGLLPSVELFLLALSKLERVGVATQDLDVLQN